MGRTFKLLTIKQHYHSGFGMVEVLLSLLIVGMIGVLSIPVLKAKPYSLRHERIMVSYQVDQTQLHAIAYLKRKDLPFYVDFTQLYYNAQGNINQAKGGKINYPYQVNITFYLGYGRYAIQ